jgi:hypothetical protein
MDSVHYLNFVLVKVTHIGWDQEPPIFSAIIKVTSMYKPCTNILWDNEYPNRILLCYIVVFWQRFQFDGIIKHWQDFLHNVLNFCSRFHFAKLLIHLLLYVIKIFPITTVNFISLWKSEKCVTNFNWLTIFYILEEKCKKLEITIYVFLNILCIAY